LLEQLRIIFNVSAYINNIIQFYFENENWNVMKCMLKFYILLGASPDGILCPSYRYAHVCSTQFLSVISVPLFPFTIFYSSSLAGAFVGCALNGSVVSTRHSANAQFYGGPIKASEILLGSVSRPAAAATLYRALSKLFEKVENYSSPLDF
jgi:hypothetical protein